jgi:hypothetical protein
MAQQELSPNAKKAIAALNALPPTELAAVVAIASATLATKIRDAVPNSTSKKRAEASSKLVEGVQAARAHGFKQVRAPDGTTAIEVKITRPNGEEVTCLLSEGARGKLYQELAGYGKNELQGATLLSHDDFEAVVESLDSTIRGQKVDNGVLQTEDAALKQAYQIVTKGVRRDGGFSWAVFDVDERGAVAGRRVGASDFWLGAGAYRDDCALFGAAPAELK